MTTKPARNVQLERVYVWYGEADTIHLSCDDRRIVDESGKHKGLNIAISKSGKPKTYRWLDLLLQNQGVER